MSLYKVPSDVNEREKVIGGVLNLVQFIWLLGGLGVGIFFFALTTAISGSFLVGIVFALLGIGLSLPFAFYRKKDLSFYEYLKYKHRLKNKNVYLVNKRKEVA